MKRPTIEEINAVEKAANELDELHSDSSYSGRKLSNKSKVSLRKVMAIVYTVDSIQPLYLEYTEREDSIDEDITYKIEMGTFFD